jgi:hypothetical protein
VRHANIQTTINVYGSAMLDSERSANSKIVRLVLTRSLQQGSDSDRGSIAGMRYRALVCRANVAAVIRAQEGGHCPPDPRRR